MKLIYFKNYASMTQKMFNNKLSDTFRQGIMFNQIAKIKHYIGITKKFFNRHAHELFTSHIATVRANLVTQSNRLVTQIKQFINTHKLNLDFSEEKRKQLALIIFTAVGILAIIFAFKVLYDAFKPDNAPKTTQESFRLATPATATIKPLKSEIDQKRIVVKDLDEKNNQLKKILDEKTRIYTELKALSALPSNLENEYKKFLLLEDNKTYNIELNDMGLSDYETSTD